MVRKDKLYNSMLTVGVDGSGSNPVIPPAPFTAVLNDNMTNASNWTVVNPNSSFTFSASGCACLYTGGSPSIFWPLTDYIYNSNYGFFNFQDYSMTITYKWNANAASGGGIQVGLVGLPNTYFTGNSWFIGVPGYYDNGNCVGYTTGPTYQGIFNAPNCVIGHTYTLTLTKLNNVIYYSNTDVTTSTTNSGSVYTCNLNLATLSTHLTNYYSMPAIACMGGNFTVTNFTATPNAYQYPDFMFMGDSITYGFNAGTVSAGWAQVTMAATPGKVPTYYAAPYYDTQNFLSAINEALNIKPKNLVLMLGGNDVAFGVPSATYQANYMSIVNQFAGIGANIILCLNTYRTTTNITPINTFINSQYSGVYPIIDCYTPIFNNASTYLSGDGTHPTAAGDAALGALVATYL